MTSTSTTARRRLAALAAVLALLVAACSGSSEAAPSASGSAEASSAASADAGTPKTGGKITVAIEGEPTSVDPAFDYDFVSGLATSSITEPLLVFCENDTKLCPNLAESWTVSDDALTYTLKIRQGYAGRHGSLRGPVIRSTSEKTRSEDYKAGGDMKATIAGTPDSVAAKVQHLIDMGINHLHLPACSRTATRRPLRNSPRRRAAGSFRWAGGGGSSAQAARPVPRRSPGRPCRGRRSRHCAGPRGRGRGGRGR